MALSTSVRARWRAAAVMRALASAALLVVAGTPMACGHDSSGNSCVKGQQGKCFGAGQCPGYQVCQADGTYGACVCGDADAGSRPFPHTGPLSGLLGAVCGADADCRHGLQCVTSDSKLIHGEGPSSGMCLSRCAVGHEELCSSVDATARCLVVDDKGTADTSDDLAYCLPGCTLGDQPASADKCRGRVDLVCTASTTGGKTGYCSPSCRSNLDCAPRFCDLGTGLCADSAPSGDPIGASCDPKSSKCAGGCVQQGTSFYECTGLCSYGTQGCGQNDAPPLDYYCSIGANSVTGDGDLGYCAKLCDCDADCNRPDAICEAQSDLVTRAGRQGMCVSKLAAKGPQGTGISSCPPR
jgi:hypothetical protein